ncbi:c-type cytochrome [Novosphingobium sp.]|uniref:c-type cytochrome n=1 Tax=Novosphingobium sp. TaxID=1874826 RepID=UPI0025F10C42|nr:c-type cytochrome [Novosphingobium sp.]MCC6926451.1 cytochrome c5 family protein [Novosphingobium sp.]
MRRLLPIATLLLAACGPGEAPPKPLTPAESAALAPSDPQLAQLYAGSCKACHTVADSQAPLTGDRTKWDPRWTKGEAALLASALQGMGKMPAGGQCFECTPDDLKRLIRFMAGREQ